MLQFTPVCNITSIVDETPGNRGEGAVVKAKSIQREQELVEIEGQKKIEGPKNWADFYAWGTCARAHAL